MDLIACQKISNRDAIIIEITTQDEARGTWKIPGILVEFQLRNGRGKKFKERFLPGDLVVVEKKDVES